MRFWNVLNGYCECTYRIGSHFVYKKEVKFLSRFNNFEIVIKNKLLNKIADNSIFWVVHLKQASKISILSYKKIFSYKRQYVFADLQFYLFHLSLSK